MQDYNRICKVTVIITCYNHGSFISEAVSSILNQTFQDFEIIIINDGSTDTDTINILNDLHHPKIKMIHQENTGPVGARNKGIRSSKSEYILPLDADDYFEKTFLEKAVGILNDNPEIGVVSSYIRLFGDINITVKPKGGYASDFLIQPNACGSSLFRKSCWEQAGGYNPNMNRGYEDWDLWLGITKHGWKVAVIEEELFFYRRMFKNSRDVIADKSRPQLIKQLIENHIEVFRENILQYAFDKENEILRLKNESLESKKAIYRSLPYKTGKIFLYPVRLFKKLFWGATKT